MFKTNNMEREVIQLDYETIYELWNDLYFDNSTTELDGIKFTKIEKINTSDYCDGECHDVIVQRDTDKKYFKFSYWEGDFNSSGNYQFSDGDNTLTEVFPRQIISVVYE
jgi:hypothetical protein